jgi:8-oxo-dGTP pyrophosphatase MutT (NUDIX family)
MTRKHGPWSIQHSERVFQNDFIEVRQDDITQPDGQPGQYATVTMSRGVAVLAIDGDNNVLLTRQFRYAIGRESLEAACGSAEDDEPARTAAERELREEIGVVASEWTDLGLCDLDTSIVCCPVQLFVARGLRFEGTEREGTETIETVKLPLDDAVRQVMNSTITHGPSCVLILKARLHVQER